MHAAPHRQADAATRAKRRREESIPAKRGAPVLLLNGAQEKVSFWTIHGIVSAEQVEGKRDSSQDLDSFWCNTVQLKCQRVVTSMPRTTASLSKTQRENMTTFLQSPTRNYSYFQSHSGSSSCGSTSDLPLKRPKLEGLPDDVARAPGMPDRAFRPWSPGDVIMVNGEESKEAVLGIFLTFLFN